MEVLCIGITTSTLAKRKGWGYKNAPIGRISKQCSIELIEETNDVLRETYWIEYYGIENLMNAKRGEVGMSRKEYQDAYQKDNKDRLIEFRKEKYNLNRDKYIQDYYNRKKPLENRICKCGIDFLATRTNKIYCCRKCKDRFNSKEKYSRLTGV